MIGPYFDGGLCLDLFAGSGALGIEAVSRGAQRAVLVDRSSADVIAKNVAMLGISSKTEIWPVSFDVALRQFHKRGYEFRWVFLDPPYQEGLLAASLEGLVRLGLLVSGATIVAEMGREFQPPSLPSLSMLKEAVYGAARVCVYERAETGGGESEHEDGGISG